MKATYRHTNIVAADWRALASFYEDVFGCAPCRRRATSRERGSTGARACRTRTSRGSTCGCRGTASEGRRSRSTATQERAPAGGGRQPRGHRPHRLRGGRRRRRGAAGGGARRRSGGRGDVGGGPRGRPPHVRVRGRPRGQHRRAAVVGVSPHRRAARLVALVAALLALALPAAGCGLGGRRRRTSSGRRGGRPGRGRGAGSGLRRPRLRPRGRGRRHGRAPARRRRGGQPAPALHPPAGVRADAARGAQHRRRPEGRRPARGGCGRASAACTSGAEQGGTVHWTHHDPSGDHAAGWLRHGGRVYR